MNYSKYGCDCDRCNPQREQEETPAVPSEVTQETLNKIDISIHNGVLNALISKQRTLSERFTRLNMQLKELEQINKELADRVTKLETDIEFQTKTYMDEWLYLSSVITNLPQVEQSIYQRILFWFSEKYIKLLSLLPGQGWRRVQAWYDEIYG